MAKGSDNEFPKLLLVAGTTPATPAAGNHALFVDSADDTLKRVDDSGTVTQVEGGGGGGSGSTGDAAWTNATLSSPWVNVSGYAVARFRKDGQGFVHLDGVVSGGSLGSTIFTLPAGYRPGSNLGYAVPAAGAFGQVAILSTGVVQLVKGSTSGHYFSGITFYAEA